MLDNLSTYYCCRRKMRASPLRTATLNSTKGKNTFSKGLFILTIAYKCALCVDCGYQRTKKKSF